MAVVQVVIAVELKLLWRMRSTTRITLTPPHEAQVMLLILQLNFSHHFCWTAAYEDDGGLGEE